MRITLTLLFALTCFTAFGNLTYIKFEKIPDHEKYADQFDFLNNNLKYYDHWQPDWTYLVSKRSLIKELKQCLKTFSQLDSENVEVDLLLGDIAHYLYNLNENDYFQKAVKYYERAIRLAPNDYRPYWFLASHYASSNVQDKSIKYFLKSQQLLPDNEPEDFWEDYAFATSVANMPSHCIYAMDKAKSILGKPGYFEQQLGQTIRNRIIPVKSDSSYNYTDIWTASQGSLISFVCRPMGLKLLIDSTWNVSFYNYKNYRAAVTIVPPAISNKAGRKITYTIALIMEVAQPGDKLDDYINNFIAKYPYKHTIDFPAKYPGLIAYEIKDKELYKDIGGAHMDIIGIKRQCPRYPGLLLEQPESLPLNKMKKMAFYRASNSKDRFKGIIYYAVMLDACEDIYPEAFKLFKQVFEKQIIIE